VVATTHALFGEFYKHLAGHKGLGESLDNARRYLRNNPRKSRRMGFRSATTRPHGTVISTADEEPQSVTPSRQQKSTTKDTKSTKDSQDVGGFQQAWPQDAMHLDGTANHAIGEFIEFHPSCPSW
jgi:hypothetical protein